MNVRTPLFPPATEMIFIANYFCRNDKERISIHRGLRVGSHGDEFSKMHKFNVVKVLHDKNRIICFWLQDYIRANSGWDLQFIQAARWVLRGVAPLYAAKKVLDEHTLGIEINRLKQAKRQKSRF